MTDLSDRSDRSDLPIRHPHAVSTTTAEQDRSTAGRRRMNLIWEVTQALIALLITLSTVYASVHGLQSEILANAFFLVIGFYFGRTNHARPSGSWRP